MSTIRIGTRGSKLALWQAEHIQAELHRLYPDRACEVVVIKTTGDKILDVPLAKIGGKGLFTKELEEAMNRDEIDLAVHSLKDVPVVFPEGFVLSCVTKRDDVRDCLLSEKYDGLESLPQGAVVGTTSLRRQMLLRKFRPDLICKDLRGNVQTRMAKLRAGEYDAIILATAGINRLGIWGELPHMVPLDETVMIPAMGQAALGIETREGSEMHALVQPLHDATAGIETTLERAFVRELEGGCQVPIGVRAVLDGDQVRAKAILGLPDGTEILEESTAGSIKEAETLGVQMAQAMKQRGASEILRRAGAMI